LTVLTFRLPAFALALLGATVAHAETAYRGPVIDVHAHLRLGDKDGLNPKQPVGTDALLKLDDDAGVRQSALIVVARKGQLDATRAQNDAVIAAAAAAPGRFFPVVSVHPADGDAAIAELERVAKLGAKMVKLHPNMQNFDVSDPAVATIAAACGRLGLVMLFDSYKPWDASQMGKFVLLSVSNPTAKFVLAHMGFSQFRETVTFAMLRKIGVGSNNVWFDISAIGTTYAGSPLQTEFVWTMRQIGVDHILFGSDWPVDTPAAAIAAVRKLGLTESEQRQIMHDNAAALLGLAP
jgi:predicted TIM-barrel fold metal-dependent hydrolase